MFMCNNTNVFTVSLDHFIASLLNTYLKCISQIILYLTDAFPDNFEMDITEKIIQFNSVVAMNDSQIDHDSNLLLLNEFEAVVWIRNRLPYHSEDKKYGNLKINGGLRLSPPHLAEFTLSGWKQMAMHLYNDFCTTMKKKKTWIDLSNTNIPNPIRSKNYQNSEMTDYPGGPINAS